MNVDRLRDAITNDAKPVAAPVATQAQQTLFVPFQPLRGVIEPLNDDEYQWRFRIFNAHQGNLPNWIYDHDDINSLIACADCLKKSGGIDYTITGLPQRDE